MPIDHVSVTGLTLILYQVKSMFGPTCQTWDHWGVPCLTNVMYVVGQADVGLKSSLVQTECITGDHLVLFAIDELHLNVSDQWGGGKFRPDMGSLHIIRQRLSTDVALLGVTATLPRQMTTEVLESCAFRSNCRITRHPHRPSIFFHLEATNDAVNMQKRAVHSIVHSIIQCGKQRHGSDFGIATDIPKAIFYVKTISDTVTFGVVSLVGSASVAFMAGSNISPSFMQN